MGGRSAERRGYGLVVFAAILLAVIGCFNLIYGIAAIANSHVFIANAHNVFANLRPPSVALLDRWPPLARPGSPVRPVIQARMPAIDAELAGRAAAGPGITRAPLIGCRELGEPRQGNIFLEPSLRTDDDGEGSKAVAPRRRPVLTVQLAKAFLLPEPVKLRGDDRGSALIGRPGEL